MAISNDGREKNTALATEPPEHTNAAVAGNMRGQKHEGWRHEGRSLRISQENVFTMRTFTLASALVYCDDHSGPQEMRID